MTPHARHGRPEAHHEVHEHASHGHGGHNHGAHDHGAHSPGAGTDEAAMAEVLELDATLAGGYAEEAAAWAAEFADGTVRSVIDLGAGTGVGTLALARQFPEAKLTAVDLSPMMLRRLRDTMERAGVGSGAGVRLRTVEADLDAEWAGLPELAESGTDLAWASSSLHHVQDPDRVLRRVLRTLRPGGLLMVLELDDLPRFLGRAGQELAALEERCHRVVGRLGWNSHPDWSDALRGAGFRLEGRRTLAVEAGGEDGSPSPELGRFARLFLTRIRAALEPGTGGESLEQGSLEQGGVEQGSSGWDGLHAGDLAALDRLLGQGPRSLERLPGLSVSTRRTAWAARRPA